MTEPVTPFDAEHARLLREVAIARGWGGKRYSEALVALRRYVARVLEREADAA